jgi:hypothetical protein
MTDAHLDAIKEAEDARIWEELNKDDPKAHDAVRNLQAAIGLLDQAEALIAQAAEAVENTTHGDVIESYLSDLEFLETDLRLQIERMK